MTLFSERFAGDTRQITDLVIDVQRKSDGLIELLENIGLESAEHHLKSAMLNRLEGMESTLRELTLLCRESLTYGASLNQIGDGRDSEADALGV